MYLGIHALDQSGLSRRLWLVRLLGETDIHLRLSVLWPVGLPSSEMVYPVQWTWPRDTTPGQLSLLRAAFNS